MKIIIYLLIAWFNGVMTGFGIGTILSTNKNAKLNK